jgi:hypothetical protein
MQGWSRRGIWLISRQGVLARRLFTTTKPLQLRVLRPGFFEVREGRLVDIILYRFIIVLIQ